MTINDDVLVVTSVRCEVPEAARQKFAQAYPGKDFRYERIDPTTPDDLIAMNKARNAFITYLQPRPLPAKAMDEGMDFVVMDNDNELYRVVRLDPILQPFTP